jgi:CHASE2 domain-containing sensor protein/two-component sensor histidine kinase
MNGIGKGKGHWARSRLALPEVVMIGAIVVARLTGMLQFLEWAALDTNLRLRPAEPIDERIVIVGIQESDIRKTQTYPIPDRTVAEVLNRLQTYQPAVIGLDIFRDLPVNPGHEQLVRALQAENVIAIDKVLPDQSGYTVDPPKSVTPEQLGFADLLFDADGKLRRSLLGTLTPQEDFRFSLAIRLAEAYLKPRELPLDNGIHDPEAMRFGDTELPRLHPNSGGYVGTEAGGNQMLINFRSAISPFRILSLQDLERGVNPDWVRGRIVLIGYTAPSVKDVVNSTAIASNHAALIYGVEAQAHMVSQIVSAVLDGRPLLQTWWDGVEYVWIIAWGVVGIAVGRLIRSPWQSFLGLTVASGSLITVSYGLLLLGWWVPLVPALLVLLLNGAGLAAFYRYDEMLRSRLEDRQVIIDQTFNTIHSGPLQTLAQLLRQLKGEGIPAEQLLAQLEHLNGELRNVYDTVRREALTQANSLYLEQEQEFDLQVPMHKTLYAVYTTVMERNLPGFKTIKLKVVNFEPLDERRLSPEQKRGLCHFLEEALCNVGKHAPGTTRLEVTCAQVEGHNVIRVTDNGAGLEEKPYPAPAGERKGLGTRQAKNLARQLGGKFHRLPNQPKGTICELSWIAKRLGLWR